MAKTLENIQKNGTTLIVGWKDTENEIDFDTTSYTISELDSGDQTTVSNFDSLLTSRLGDGETLDRSLTQITVQQHLSQERVLWYIDGDENPRFMIISSINNIEKTIYDAYKTLCSTLINS